MSYNPNNPNGQATMANSAPVVIASNQSDVPVDTELADPILADDSTAAPTTAPTYSFLMGLKSGTNQWARARMAPDNVDNLGTDSTGHLQVLAHAYVFNGTAWDRVRGGVTFGMEVDVTRFNAPIGITGPISVTQGSTWIVNQGAAPWTFLGAGGSMGVLGFGGSMSVLNAGGSLSAFNAGGSLSVLGGSMSVQGFGGSMGVLAFGGSMAVAGIGGSMGVLAFGGSLSVVGIGGSMSVFGAGGTMLVGGTMTVVGPGANAAAIVGNPVRIAGSDGTNTRNLITDTAGNLYNRPAAVATATLSNVAASASSVTILSANTSRRQVVLVNDSSAICYVKFGTTASTTSYTVQMPAIANNQAAHLFIDEDPVYNGRIDAIWASATGNMRVTEITT